MPESLGFSLAGADLLELSSDGDGEVAMPEDFADVVARRGDRYRDAFTRACLYLTARHPLPFAQPDQVAVVVATEYGNLDAMLRLQEDAIDPGRRVSAQAFPYATTSSASIFVNIAMGWSGANLTMNGGRFNASLGLLQAVLHVNEYEEGASILLIGDAYCSRARADVAKDRRSDGVRVRSGVACVVLRTGTDYEASFRFDRSGSDRVTGSASPTVTEPIVAEEWNSAFVVEKVFRAVNRLSPGEAATLVQEGDDRHCTVAVRSTT